MDNQQPSPKEPQYVSLESFRDFANDWFSNARTFKSVFSGERELAKYGEKTMWFDEESLYEIEQAYSHMIEIIKSANVVVRKKVSHLSIVK